MIRKLLDDVLQDAWRAAVLSNRVRQARLGRPCDDQGGAYDGRRVQDAGVVSEDAWRGVDVIQVAVGDNHALSILHM